MDSTEDGANTHFTSITYTHSFIPQTYVDTDLYPGNREGARQFSPRFPQLTISMGNTNSKKRGDKYIFFRTTMDTMKNRKGNVIHRDWKRHTFRKVVRKSLSEVGTFVLRPSESCRGVKKVVQTEVVQMQRP